MAYIAFRYLHLLAIVVLAGALVIENLAIARSLSREDVLNLAKVDLVYGISAGLALAFGLILWLGVGKPSDFYSSNPLFHAKLGLFALVVLLSITPTVFFLRQRKSTTEPINVPPAILWMLRCELLLLLCIPVLAALMARGIGLSS